jgi:hypothetical protein
VKPRIRPPSPANAEQIERGQRVLEESRASREAAFDRLTSWRVPMLAYVTISLNQKLKFNPPIGAYVNEPSEWQRFAKAYKYQECVVIGADKKDPDEIKFRVKFSDGAERSLPPRFLRTLDFPYEID